MKHLDNLISGKEMKAPKVLIYGPPGVGKSTFASTCKDPLFLDFENRLNHLDVTKTEMITKFEVLEEIMPELRTEFKDDKDREFQTLIIDTVDRMIDVIHEYICKTTGAKHIDDARVKELEFGKGRVWTREIVKGLLTQLTELNEKKNVTVVLVGHSTIERYENPMTESYDRYALALNSKTAAYFYNWADIIGFMDMKMFTKEEDAGFSKKKTKAVGTSKRVMRLEPRPYYHAKNSYNLPAVWEVTNWTDLSKLIKKNLKGE